MKELKLDDLKGLWISCPKNTNDLSYPRYELIIKDRYLKRKKIDVIGTFNDYNNTNNPIRICLEEPVILKYKTDEDYMDEIIMGEYSSLFSINNELSYLEIIMNANKPIRLIRLIDLRC